jgi:penicillin-binding protein 1A
MEPYLVEKVTTEKSGEEVVLESHRLKGNRALSRDEAAVTTQTLRGVVEDGTASQFHDLDEELGRPSAGKTGTTERFRDAWYVGYVPQLATSVWVGYPKPKSMVNVNGLDEINGENYPLDIWSAYMREAVKEFPEQEFDKPSPDFELDKKTGGRAYKEAETTGASSSFQDFLDKLRSGGGEETETTSEPQPVEPQPVEPQPVEPTVAPPVETNPEVTVAPITTVTTAPTVTPERNPRRNQGSKRRKNRQSTPRREKQSNPRPNTQRNPANSNDGDLVDIPDF